MPSDRSSVILLGKAAPDCIPLLRRSRPRETVTVSLSDMVADWSLLDEEPEEVQLVAIGSPTLLA